ncbi:MAG: HEPN domain-containing protein, partial [Candidatus Hydrothermarchaeota archaeon]
MPRYAIKHLNKSERLLMAAEHDFRDDFYDMAISHAYYALHHAARALLLLIEESPRTHSGVINVLWKNLRKIGLEEDDIKNLSRAFSRRVECDYGVELGTPSKESAQE